MSFLVEKISSFYSVFSLLDIRIVAFVELNPNLCDMKYEWFRKQIEDLDLSTVEIVLISDPRSFFVSELLFKCEEFQGVILCTESVYRIGRLHVLEDQFLLSNNNEPLPTHLTLISLQFQEQFPYSEICITPLPNGTGIGNCNWLVTQGVDPELVTFSAFIIVGFCQDPVFFSKPIPPKRTTYAVVLPTAFSTTIDFKEQMDKIASIIDANIREKRKIVIPSYIDDSLYSIMYYLRFNKSITSEFFVVSSYWKQLKAQLKSLPNEHEYNKLSYVEYLDLSQARAFHQGAVYFAPDPSLKYGQVTKMVALDSFVRLMIHGNCDQNYKFTTNSSWPLFLHFLEGLRAQYLCGPPELLINGKVEAPAELNISNDIIRWTNINEMKKYLYADNQPFQQKFSIVNGYIEGERAFFTPVHHHNVLNSPDIEELGLLLREQGASNLRKKDNKIKFKFDFIKGDNEATIKMNSQEIIIRTGSVEIERVLMRLIGIN